MSENILAIWAVVFLAMISPCQAQYDPLASDIFTLPGEKRSTGSLSAQVHTDTNADPLGIDALMQPLDPEHSIEYLNKISGRTYLGPFVPSAQDLSGNWHLLLHGGSPGEVQLLLVQNRDAVFGRGYMYLAGSAGMASSVSASGQAVKDVLYLDLIDAEKLVLYRCTLTMRTDFLSGGFAAFDARGQAWSGTIQGSRPA